MPGKHTKLLKAYDEALKQTSTENLKLSIQLALDGFSFSIFNPESQKYLSIESSYNNPEGNPYLGFDHFMSTFSKQEWFKQSFAAVNIYYEIPVVSLVPSPLFNENEQETLSKFNFSIPSDHHLKNEPLQNLDAYLLYHEPDQLAEKVLEVFEGATLQSHARILVDSLLLINKNLSTEKRMYVNIRNGYLDILIIEGKQLLFYNIFRYHSKEDFIYYILFVMDQLDVSPEEISLELTGFIDKQSALYEVAYKYVKNINFIQPSASFTFSHVFDKIPLHYYFNLFNAPLCES